MAKHNLKFILLSLLILLLLISINPIITTASIYTPPNLVVTCEFNISVNTVLSGSISATTPIRVNVSGSMLSTCGSPSGNNIFFVNSLTQTVLTSQLYGNTFNLDSNTNINNLPIGANAIWYVLPSAGGIASGVTASNYITLETVATSQNLFNGTKVCESPQLSPTYGQYSCDNKIWTYNVFFGGLSSNALPGGTNPFTLNGVGGNVIDRGSNIMIVSSLAGSGGVNTIGISQISNTAENTIGNEILELAYPVGVGNTEVGQSMNPVSFSHTNTIVNIFNFGPSAGYSEDVFGVINAMINSQGKYDLGSWVNYQTNPTLWSIKLVTGSKTIFGLNFSDKKIDTNSISAAANAPLYVVATSSNSNTAHPLIIYYIDAGPIPSNGINPTISLGPKQSPPPGTPTLSLSNTLIDQGQYIMFTASITDGNGPFAYNYLVTTNGPTKAKPQVMWYCTTFDNPNNCGSLLNQLTANGQYVTAVTILAAQVNGSSSTLTTFGGTPTLNYNFLGSGQTDTTMNSYITGFQDNGIKVYLGIGGCSQAQCTQGSGTQALYSSTYNQLFGGNPAASATFIGNLVNVIGTSSFNGIGGYNGILMDVEVDTPVDVDFSNVPIFSGELESNMIAKCPSCILSFTVSDEELSTSHGFNVASMVGNVNYIDVIDDPNVGVQHLLNVYSPNAPTSKLSYYTDITSPQYITANYLINNTEAISNGLNVETFDLTLLPGNYYTLNDMAQALNIGGNVIVANQLYTGVSGSTNSFFWNPPADLYIGNTFKANVIITDSLSNVANSVYHNFGYNSALMDMWSATNSIVPLGTLQTLTSTTNSGTGTSPWSYNILVYNSIGSLVYNSLSGYTSSISNTISYVQQSSWGSGTFTANLFITDSATTPVTVSNTLTYSATQTWAAPSGIVEYENISINNLDTVNAIPQYSVLNITVNTLTVAQYANNGFTNFEIFNGFPETNAIPYQIMVGNTANVLQTYGLNTVNSLRIDLNLPFSIAAGTDAVNVLTIGFFAQSVNSVTGNNIGESPLLTCPNFESSGSTSCSWGKNDNGANVYLIYSNFTSSTALSAPVWNPTITQTGGISHATNNGLYITETATGSSTFGLITQMAYAAPLTIETFAGNYQASGGTPSITLGETTSNTFEGSGSGAYELGYGIGWHSTNSALFQLLGSASQSTLFTITQTQPWIDSVEWYDTGNIVGFVGTSGLITIGNSVETWSTPQYVSISEGGQLQAAGSTLYYIKAYPSAYNSVIPQITFGSPHS